MFSSKIKNNDAAGRNITYRSSTISRVEYHASYFPISFSFFLFFFFLINFSGDLERSQTSVGCCISSSNQFQVEPALQKLFSLISAGSSTSRTTSPPTTVSYSVSESPSLLQYQPSLVSNERSLQLEINSAMSQSGTSSGIV